jgi:hypothetical protein
VKAAAEALVEAFVAAKIDMRYHWDTPQTLHGTYSKLRMNVNNAGEKRNRVVNLEATIWLFVS